MIIVTVKVLTPQISMSTGDLFVSDPAARREVFAEAMRNGEQFVQIARFNQEFTPPVTPDLLDEMHSWGYCLALRDRGRGWRTDVIVVGEQCWRRNVNVRPENRWTPFALEHSKVWFNLGTLAADGAVTIIRK